MRLTRIHKFATLFLERRGFCAASVQIKDKKSRERLSEASRSILLQQLRCPSSELPQTVKVFSIPLAIRLLRSVCLSQFDETIEISLKMNLDPKKQNQSMRGSFYLPHGVGKPPIVAVFAKGDKAVDAREAGAEYVGDDDLAKMVMEKNIPFQKCLATPDMMGIVGKLGRILGPRGLMPNAKLGTMTMDIVEAIKKSKMGEVNYRLEKTGLLPCPVGKMSLTDEQIFENIESFIKDVFKAKPDGASERLIIKATLSSTMGPGCVLNLGEYPFKK